MAALMDALRHVIVALILCGLSLRVTEGGSLIKVWELDLRTWNKSPGGNADKFPVAALGFSPDGKRIALTGTETKKNDGKLIGLLLVIPVGASEEGVKSFEADPMSAFLQWSPSLDAIVVNSVLIRLDAGASCSLPNIVHFISGDHFVGQTRGVSPDSATRFATYDMTCHPSKAWETPERWYMLDVSIQRHLVLVNNPFKENLLVDPDDGRIVRRWPVGNWPVLEGPNGKFADRGTALCGGVSVQDAPQRSTLRCWNADTGRVIGDAPAEHATGPFVTSRSSTRVVFSEAGYVRGLIPDFDTHPYKGAAVWDFATGEKLASWRPRTQTWTELGLRPPKRITEPSKFAISNDGQFLAEGGDGKLTVYKIEQ
jgi:hypothetical protein